MTMDEAFFTHMTNMYKAVRAQIVNQPDVCRLLDDMIDQLTLYRLFGDEHYLRNMKVSNQKLKQRVSLDDFH